MSSHQNISALPPPPNKKNKKKKQITPEEILNNIRRSVENSNFMSGASIYRVPKRLYDLNKKAYTPRLVSIGPLHCKDQHLKTPMQDIKMNYVNSFLDRMGGDSDKQKLELLIDEMHKLLTNARKCYAEEVGDELDEEMLVIDGCFILELLYKYHEKWRNHKIFKDYCMSVHLNQSSFIIPPHVSQLSNTISHPEKSDAHHPHDPISGSKLTFLTVQHDLLLLENQLPFFALENLFDFTKKRMPTSSSMPSLDSLSQYVGFFFFNMTKLGPRVDTTKSGPKKTKLGPGVDTTKGDPKKSCWKGETESVIVQVEKKESVMGSKKQSVNKGFLSPIRKESGPFHILHILLDGFHSFEDKTVKKENPVLEALVNILWPPQKFFSRDGNDDSGICPTGRDGNDNSGVCPTDRDDNDDEICPTGRDGDDHNGICPSASELVEAGVKLLGCTSFEIKFYEADTPFGWCRRARFEIPILKINDSTELFFRNLIAFEQCYPGIVSRFTSYAALMDNLISTVKDVEVLEKAGVISDCLGSRQEVVNLFNKLCKNVVDDEVFNKTYRQATAYTKRFLPKSIAYLRRQYFATPWTTIAFAVAFIAFGITVTKFIQSFLP